MQNRWSEAEAAGFVNSYEEKWGKDLSLRLYSSFLIGTDETLVLHGGGNASVKTLRTDLFGKPVEAILVKASGYDMALADPAGYTALDLLHMKSLLDHWPVSNLIE